MRIIGGCFCERGINAGVVNWYLVGIISLKSTAQYKSMTHCDYVIWILLKSASKSISNKHSVGKWKHYLSQIHIGDLVIQIQCNY